MQSPPSANTIVTNQPASLIDSAKQFAGRHSASLLCAAILMLMGANLFSIIGRKTITNDEMLHIPSGYHYLTGGDFRQNPEHPSLIKMWACLPLLVLVRPQPASFARSGNQNFAEFTATSSLEFWRNNRQSFEALIFWSRVPMIILTLTLGAVIFIVGRELFGSRAGLFAVAMFSLEPTMLAYGRVVHTDIAAALAYLLFFVALCRFFQAATMSRAVWLGLAMSFALLAKFSMVVLIPILIGGLIYAVWKAPVHQTTRSRMSLQTLIAVFIPLVAINAAYYFQHPPLAQPELDWFRTNVQLIPTWGHLAFRLLAIPLPTYYVFGLFTVLVHNQDGHETALLGNFGRFGWWYYFPVAFALKTTIPFLLVSIGSLIWATWLSLVERHRKYLWLILPVVLYLAISMTSHINIGVRHITPIFPFLFVLGGALLDWLSKRLQWRLAALLMMVLFGWMMIEAVRGHPDYIPYTNQLTLGKAGWELLSDSNVEWGDDVSGLAKYLRAHGETRIQASMSGGWVLEMYGVQMIDNAPPELKLAKTRYVAIGAAYLNGSTVPVGWKDENGVELVDGERQKYFAKYRSETPEVIFGKSIYLYRKQD